ncbi:MAG: methyl-accepting chemotaxis protein [Spirochaetia bacterium]|nr:methyl-accepting chemotaxis protein [Spirochaetia bacterium]
MLQNRKKTSLKRKMVFYFLLVAFANVFVGLELLLEIKSDKYRSQVIEKMTHIKDGQESEASIFLLLDQLTRKFFIMVGILILVSAVILFLFVIQIASPIQYMINEAKKIAGGDLSVNLNMKSKDEVSDLGNLINDLTANLQEIIVQLQNMHANFEEAATCLECKLNLLPELQKYFQSEQKQLKDNVESIAMIKQSFTVYQMRKFILDDFSPHEKKLMDAILADNVITKDQYDEVLKIQMQRGGFVGAILKELDYIDSAVLLKHLYGR